MRQDMGQKKWWMIALVLYILFIFGNSIQPAAVSSGQSSAVLELVVKSLSAVGFGGSNVTEHLIRKTAHFAEYTLLGMLIYKNMQIQFAAGRDRVFSALLMGFAVPFMDETIQLFVEGRSGQISDVWLDLSGVFFGIGLVLAAAVLITRKRGKLKLEKKY